MLALTSNFGTTILFFFFGLAFGLAFGFSFGSGFALAIFLLFLVFTAANSFVDSPRKSTARGIGAHCPTPFGLPHPEGNIRSDLLLTKRPQVRGSGAQVEVISPRWFLRATYS